MFAIVELRFCQRFKQQIYQRFNPLIVCVGNKKVHGCYTADQLAGEVNNHMPCTLDIR